MDSPEVVAVLAALATVALAVVARQLWARNRTLRHALVHARAATEPEREPEGLAAGVPAPNFHLPALHGGKKSLEALRDGGRPVLLVFFDPGCGPCHGLLPHLPRWQAALADRVAVAVVSSGSAKANKTVFDGHPIEVLLEGEGHVSSAYRVAAWPQAVAVAPDGRIAYEPALSLDTMEVLIRVLLETVAPPAPPLHATTAAATATAAQAES